MHIIGILNITPNSFSDGNHTLTPQKALIAAKKMMNNGAHFIDIGGESTAPNAEKISFEEEFARVAPVFELLKQNNIPCSLDSYKAKMWEYFLENGGEIVNDVSGMQAESDKKWELLQKHPTAKVIIMFSHFGKTLTTHNVMPEMKAFFTTIFRIAKEKKIEKSRIIIDPGMGGFLSSNPEVSFVVLKNIADLLCFGSKILVGTSRKSFLKAVSHPTIPKKRDAASVATSWVALQNGATFVRVHNVPMMKEIIETYKKLS